MAADTDTPTPAESAHEDGAGLREDDVPYVDAALKAFAHPFCLEAWERIKATLAHPSAQDAGGECTLWGRGDGTPRRAPTDDGAGLTGTGVTVGEVAAEIRHRSDIEQDESIKAAVAVMLRWPMGFCAPGAELTAEDVNDFRDGMRRGGYVEYALGHMLACRAARQGGARTAEGLGAEDIAHTVEAIEDAHDSLNTKASIDANVLSRVLAAARTPTPEVAAAPGVQAREDTISGELCFAGQNARIPVRSVLSFAQAGYTPEAIQREYPTLSLPEITAASALAAAPGLGGEGAHDEDPREGVERLESTLKIALSTVEMVRASHVWGDIVGPVKGGRGQDDREAEQESRAHCCASLDDAKARLVQELAALAPPAVPTPAGEEGELRVPATFGGVPVVIDPTMKEGEWKLAHALSAQAEAPASAGGGGVEAATNAMLSSAERVLLNTEMGAISKRTLLRLIRAARLARIKW